MSGLLSHFPQNTNYVAPTVPEEVEEFLPRENEWLEDSAFSVTLGPVCSLQSSSCTEVYHSVMAWVWGKPSDLQPGRKAWTGWEATVSHWTKMNQKQLKKIQKSMQSAVKWQEEGHKRRRSGRARGGGGRENAQFSSSELTSTPISTCVGLLITRTKSPVRLANKYLSGIDQLRTHWL